MSIAFRGHSLGHSGYVASPYATTKPSGLVAGDLMLMHVYCSYSGGVTLPDGWTLLHTSSGTYVRGKYAYRFATQADVDAWDHELSWLSGSHYASFLIMAFSGVDETTPYATSVWTYYGSWPNWRVDWNGLDGITVALEQLIVLSDMTDAGRTHSDWRLDKNNPANWVEGADESGAAKACGFAYANPIASPGSYFNTDALCTLSGYSYTFGVAILLNPAPEVVYADDDLDGSHRLLVWAAADDLDGSHRLTGVDDLSGSHRLLAWVDDDLSGSHGVGWENESLAGSHRVLIWTDEDLDGSHRVMVWAPADDLAGSHRLMAWAPDDELSGSHRLLVWADDDLSGTYALIPAGVPASEPPLLYVPQLSLLLDDADSVPLDLIAEGADPASVRFANSVIGGHGRCSVEIPQGPARLCVNGLHRGMDAALFDRGHKLHEGTVLTVAGDDEGGGGVTTVTIGGPLEAADLDRGFEWIWVDADYGRWEEVVPPLDTVERKWLDAYSTTRWDPQGWSDAPWEVRCDGELYIGTLRGATYRGDAFWRSCPRARLAYVLDRRLFNWPSGSYEGLGQIMAWRFDYRAELGSYFRLRAGGLASPWVWTSPGGLVCDGGSHADNDVDHAVDAPCIVVELLHYRQTDTVAAGEHVQILHPRVLVRPDGPGARSWAVGDRLPRLDECMSDVMLDADGLLATSVEAEPIGEELEDAAASGPTRSAALAQLAEYDEDEDGSGQPLEYGIWDDGVAIIRRREAAPARPDRWLAIDSDRDDVTVRVEYEDCEAPDYVEVRYAYRRTNLIRHGSPAAAGYWESRGCPDGLPYDWASTGSVAKVTESDELRWQLAAGATMRFPADGSYPIVPDGLAHAYPNHVASAVIPLIAHFPLRFQFWAKGSGYVTAVYRLNSDNMRGSDTLFVGGIGEAIDGDWELRRTDWYPDPSSAAYELLLSIIASGGTLTWRNAQLYYLMPDGIELSAWWPEQPTRADASVETYTLPHAATIWQARNSARRFYNSFARGTGKGTITARGVLHDVRGREVPVSRIRGGWWASIVNDPRCEKSLYVSGVSDVDPYALEAELCIGGEQPPWSARPPLHERRTFGRYEDWRGFRPLGGRR